MNHNMKKEVKFKFESLIIWQKSMNFGEQLNQIANQFPKYEKYNLSNQIRRAGDSIALNIAEGSIGQSKAEFKKFMSYSIRSLAEVITCLYKAQRRNYITQDEFNTEYDFAYHLMNMMIGFKEKIK